MPSPSYINREVDRRPEEEVQRNFQQVEDCLFERAPGHLSGPTLTGHLLTGQQSPSEALGPYFRSLASFQPL